MEISEIKALLKQVTYRDWRFLVEADHGAPYLVIEFDEPCNVTGKPAVQRSRKWRLSRHMTRSEIVQTAFKALHAAIEHEAREQFLYRGRAIFGPHFDIDRLHDLCGSGAADVRAPLHN